MYIAPCNLVYCEFAGSGRVVFIDVRLAPERRGESEGGGGKKGRGEEAKLFTSTFSLHIHIQHFSKVCVQEIYLSYKERDGASIPYQ